MRKSWLSPLEKASSLQRNPALAPPLQSALAFSLEGRVEVQQPVRVVGLSGLHVGQEGIVPMMPGQSLISPQKTTCTPSLEAHET